MNTDDVFRWIMHHKGQYPGPHLRPQPRTTKAHKPLEPLSQFHLIMNSTYTYLKENMQAGRGVNIAKFGAFTFEINSGFIKPAQQVQFDLSKSLQQQRMERKHIHKLRPCFVPNQPFKYCLKRYSQQIKDKYGKEEISKPKSQHSIYQKGFGMIYCNPVPIAMSCYLGKNVVVSAHKAFFKAICDLTSLGHSLNINMKFVSLRIVNKNLYYQYSKGFVGGLNTSKYELKLRQSDTSCKRLWKQTYKSKWNKSHLSVRVKRPDLNKKRREQQKTLALKLMSLDMNTATQTLYSKERKLNAEDKVAGPLNLNRKLAISDFQSNCIKVLRDVDVPIQLRV